jgi:hypothetical protein
VRYREDSPLLTEHRHLVYLPTKPGKPLKDHADRRSSDGKVHGNHCSDAGLYSFRHLTHYLATGAISRPEPGTREAYTAEEAKVERSIEEADRRREERLAEADELAAEYGGDGAYDAY